MAEFTGEPPKFRAGSEMIQRMFFQNMAPAVSKQDLRWSGRAWREDMGSGPWRTEGSAHQEQEEEWNGENTHVHN